MTILSRCDRCESQFIRGEARYVLNVESFADVDTEVEFPQEAQGDSAGDTLQEILDDLAPLSEEEIDRQVYERFRLVLCKTCRDAVSGSLPKHQEKPAASPSNRVH